MEEDGWQDETRDGQEESASIVDDFCESVAAGEGYDEQPRKQHGEYGGDSVIIEPVEFNETISDADAKDGNAGDVVTKGEQVHTSYRENSVMFIDLVYHVFGRVIRERECVAGKESNQSHQYSGYCNTGC